MLIYYYLAFHFKRFSVDTRPWNQPTISWISIGERSELESLGLCCGIITLLVGFSIYFILCRTQHVSKLTKVEGKTLQGKCQKLKQGDLTVVCSRRIRCQGLTKSTRLHLSIRCHFGYSVSLSINKRYNLAYSI